MTRTLVVTNDFPPRPGGIQQFVHGLLVRQPADSVVVLASRWRGDDAFDREQPFPVIRYDTAVLLPEPRVRRRAAAIARSEGCDRVLFGAAAPLGLMAPSLRSAGVARSVGLTHGHEAGWTAWPGTRQMVARVGRRLDALTYLGEYTRSRIAAAIGPAAAGRMVRLTPGVDAAMFHPGAGGDDVRRRLGLQDRPVIVCVSRLMPRKGQDVLVRALPAIRRRVPDAALLLVGGGPHRARIERLVREHGLDDHVVMTGSVPWAELPAHYDAGDVFAMPCRTRMRGLDVEGLGIVYLEASATGLPVVAGASGGAPDAVLEGRTGWVVDGRDVDAVAQRILAALQDPAAARLIGEAGREWVQREWSWERQAAVLSEVLDGTSSA
jgi:phosphatidylinositol alpha-1,6-mannosyltransferase